MTNIIIKVKNTSTTERIGKFVSHLQSLINHQDKFENYFDVIDNIEVKYDA